MKYPKEVPVLTEKDFRKGGSLLDDNCHCILEWVAITFAGDEFLEEVKRNERPLWDWELPPKIAKALGRAMESVEPKKCVGICDSVRGICMTLNDKKSVPRRNMAKTFNRATALLGYTEGNPEGKWDA